MRIPWYIKAAVQKCIAALPFATQFNYAIQRNISRSLRLSDALLDERLERVAQHLAVQTPSAQQPNGKVALELGTGWYPVVPALLWLYGYERVYSVDIHPHIRPELLAETQAVMLRHRERISQYIGEADATRWEQFAAADFFQKNIIFLQQDARTVSLPEKSIDLIVSNNTLEHIPAATLREILTAFAPLLREETGQMSHYIDMHDHYAYGDAGISPYHFLRYSARQWAWIENSLQSQNRLRLPQYRALCADAGLHITQETPEWGFPETLLQEPLHPDFQRFSVAECAALYVHLVLRLTTHSPPPTSP